MFGGRIPLWLGVSLSFSTRPDIAILVEKPLFTDPNDLQRVEKLRETHKAPIWVAMEYRYMPPIAALLERMQDATGGAKMLTIREHRFPFLEKVGDWNRFNENTGGTLVEKCCHFFDLMRLVLRDDPVRIMASGSQSVNHLDEVYDGETSDIWDNAYVIVEFAKGARAMLNCACLPKVPDFRRNFPPSGLKEKSRHLFPDPSDFGPKTSQNLFHSLW